MWNNSLRIDPIRDYRVPIKQLAQWFDTLTVTRKREDISNLLQKLMNERNGPNNKIILPEIPFPTLNGQLVEPEGYNIEFEEEEMEDDDEVRFVFIFFFDSNIKLYYFTNLTIGGKYHRGYG